MAFGTVDGEKGELAASVAAAIGLLTDAPGNRLGIVTLVAHGLGGTARTGPDRGAPPNASCRPRRRGASTVGLAEALTAFAARGTAQGFGW